jgi:hypothetical protein
VEYVAAVLAVIGLALIVLYAIWARRVEKRVGPSSEATGEPTKRFGFFSLFGKDAPHIPPGGRV